MRVSVILTVALAAAALPCLHGCRTPAGAGEEALAAVPESPVLVPTPSSRAEALAYFSQGLIEERNRNFGAALTNYQHALAFDADNEELHLRVAIGLLQQKRPLEALELLEKLCERKPRSEKALLSLGLLYKATDQQQKLEQIYRRLIDLNPAQPGPYVDLAALYIKAGRESEAVALLERGNRRIPDAADILKLLGAIHLQRAAASTTPEAARKHRQAALRILETAAEKSPDNVAVLYQLGDLYIQAGEIDKAVGCFTRIEEKNPGSLQIKQKLALSFLVLGDKEKAIGALEDLAEERPGNPRVYYYLGELYNEQGEKERALLNFALSAAASSNDPSPYVKLALTEIDANPDEAIRYLNQGLEKLPNDPVLNEVLGYTYFSKKEYATAVDYFDSARAVVEKQAAGAVNPAFYFNYSVACLMAGRLDQAATNLAKAFAKDSVYLDAYVQYAFRQKDEARTKDAIAVLEKIGQSQPDEANLYVYLGLLNSYLKTYKAALSAFEKAEALLEDSPTKKEVLDSQFYFWYGAACEREGLFERAEEMFEKSIELEPRNSEAYNYLAYMWAEKGSKLDKALEYVRKALELNPDSGAFVDTLGWVYYMQGDYTNALQEIRRATGIIPDDPTIVEHLGDVLLKLGDEQQALPHWERSFVLEPENEKVAEKLKQHGVDLEPLRKQADELKEKKAREQAEKKETKGLMPATATEPPDDSAPMIVIPSAGTNGPDAMPEALPDGEPAPNEDAEPELVPDKLEPEILPAE